ncbi:MAG: prephenate dehydrogenase/arogenate dehydrogenase family protein [Planctomycetes bacterium]|nr:prephenate dehydrogenase/arogenate dehydrogenase family protein [Planctomycetota bacterium]
MLVPTLTIVGVGLIGGSIGLAAQKRGVARRVIGFGRDPGKLAAACKLGAITESADDLATAVRAADLVVFCTPVDRIIDQVHDAAPYAKPAAIFTDAGSTKRAIVRAAPPGVAFVGGHPLAGSEKKGAEHAHADLFVDRWTVLTPTEQTLIPALEAVSVFWKALGAHIRTMTPEDHDQALACTSHLPHLVASALAGILPVEWRDLTATGFRDMTRLAAGAPEVWTPIFQHNRQAVLDALARLDERLAAFRRALTDNDAATMDQFLAQAKKVRDALGS